MAPDTWRRTPPWVGVIGGVVIVSASLATSVPAAADPIPAIPVDPSVPVAVVAPVPPGPPPPATIGAPLAQNGIPGGRGGVPDLSRTGNDFLLGQASVPSAPGTMMGAPPPLNPLDNTYLLEQNLVPSSPGEGTVFGVAPGDENAVTTWRDYLKRLHASYRQGGLAGGFLGQRPQDQLGEPLPGTAPLPGLQIPPGLNAPAPPPAPSVDATAVGLPDLGPT
jgi:hypothetical protein